MALVKKIVVLFLALFFLLPASVFARIGVGVATGKIVVEDKLRPGMIYQFPPFTILNTGDVPSDFQADISYLEKQPQLRPPKQWFIFSPQKFHLDPGGAQVVDVKLNLPLRVEPGDYFAYLEGLPVVTPVAGQTNVGIAAASKLYFTVLPGSFWEGIYYKGLSFWKVYSPWTERVALGLTAVTAYLLFRKFFKLQIGLKKQGSQTKNSKMEEIKTPDE